MLRSLFQRPSGALSAVARRLNTQPGPSPTTSVILTKLPPTIVESKLKEALASLNGCRRMELEPGCSLFFANECEARVAGNLLNVQHGVKTVVSKASMPCVVLQNVPENVTVDLLEQGFSGQNPGAVRLSGAITMQVQVKSDVDAWKAVNAIQSTTINGQQLKACSVRVTKQNHFVTVFNIPAAAASAEVRKAINDALAKADLSSTAVVDRNKPSKATVMLRFPSDFKVTDSFKNALSASFEVGDVTPLRKPALFLRNVYNIEDDEEIEELMGEHYKNVERVQFLRKAEDKVPNMIVAYFRSEEGAIAAAAELHNKIDGEYRISAAYREVTEPALRLSNLPEDTTAEELQELVKKLHTVRVDHYPDERAATITLSSPREVRLAKQLLHNHHLRNSVLSAEEHEVFHVGVPVVLKDASEVRSAPAAIAAALKTVEVAANSMVVQTNARAEVAFFSVNEAHKALDRFTAGHVRLPEGGVSGTEPVGSKVTSGLSTLPTFVLQVQGLSAETPVQAVLDDVAAGLPGSKVLRADRSALLKFKRNQLVLSGMKELKKMEFDGQKVKVQRYRPLEQSGDSGYDKVTGKALKDNAAIDKFCMSTILKDFMHLDPATRYQIAKNAFFRALYDARGDDDPSSLFDDSHTWSVEDEVHDLFYGEGDAEEMSEEEINNRLFQIYLQKQENMRYRANFRELSVLLGEPDDNDSFDWTQFDAQDNEDIERMLDEMREADAEALDQLVAVAKGKAVPRREAALSASEGESAEEEEDSASGSASSSSSSDSSSASESDSTDADLEAPLSADEEEEMLGQVNDDVIVRLKEASLLGSDSDSASSSGSDSSSSSSSTSSSEVDSDDEIANFGGKKKKLELDEQDEDDTVEERKLRKRMAKVFMDQQGNEMRSLVLPNGDFIDVSGNKWSMLVIDSDTTQKSLAGGRVLSHRTLVVMGNMQGTAGYGMGKGATPQDALDSACRAAMRNLLHIDLFDNCSLAHDLYGKHNACHCYIRATPASRVMVASPVVAEVLLRFGITSASVKMAGKRSPYSQINALFNALSHHENLDETARDRGQRYLTLRWAHDKNI